MAQVFVKRPRRQTGELQTPAGSLPAGQVAASLSSRTVTNTHDGGGEYLPNSLGSQRTLDDSVDGDGNLDDTAPGELPLAETLALEDSSDDEDTPVNYDTSKLIKEGMLHKSSGKDRDKGTDKRTFKLFANRLEYYDGKKKKGGIELKDVVELVLPSRMKEMFVEWAFDLVAIADHTKKENEKGRLRTYTLFVEAKKKDLAKQGLAQAETAEWFNEIKATRDKFSQFYAKPVKQGYMHKSSSKMVAKGMEHRYFVLHTDRLEYFTDEKMDELKGVIQLALVKRIVFPCKSFETPATKACGAFDVVTVREDRVFSLFAATLEESRAWFDAIAKELADVKARGLARQLEGSLELVDERGSSNSHPYRFSNGVLTILSAAGKEERHIQVCGGVVVAENKRRNGNFCIRVYVDAGLATLYELCVSQELLNTLVAAAQDSHEALLGATMGTRGQSRVFWAGWVLTSPDGKNFISQYAILFWDELVLYDHTPSIEDCLVRIKAREAGQPTRRDYEAAFLLQDLYVRAHADSNSIVAGTAEGDIFIIKHVNRTEMVVCLEAFQTRMAKITSGVLHSEARYVVNILAQNVDESREYDLVFTCDALTLYDKEVGGMLWTYGWFDLVMSDDVSVAATRVSVGFGDSADREMVPLALVFRDVPENVIVVLRLRGGPYSPLFLIYKALEAHIAESNPVRTAISPQILRREVTATTTERVVASRRPRALSMSPLSTGRAAEIAAMLATADDSVMSRSPSTPSTARQLHRPAAVSPLARSSVVAGASSTGESTTDSDPDVTVVTHPIADMVEQRKRSKSASGAAHADLRLAPIPPEKAPLPAKAGHGESSPRSPIASPTRTQGGTPAFATDRASISVEVPPPSVSRTPSSPPPRFVVSPPPSTNSPSFSSLPGDVAGLSPLPSLSSLGGLDAELLGTVGPPPQSMSSMDSPRFAGLLSASPTNLDALIAQSPTTLKSGSSQPVAAPVPAPAPAPAPPTVPARASPPSQTIEQLLAQPSGPPTASALEALLMQPGMHAPAAPPEPSPPPRQRPFIPPKNLGPPRTVSLPAAATVASVVVSAVRTARQQLSSVTEDGTPASPNFVVPKRGASLAARISMFAQTPTVPHPGTPGPTRRTASGGSTAAPRTPTGTSPRS